MTRSKRESVILALAKELTVVEDRGTKVYRNLDKPQKIPADGIIIVRDNEAAKEVDVLLNPLTYIFELNIQLEVIIQHPDASARTKRLDELLIRIEKIISKNRTLNGFAEWVELKQAEFQDEPIEGAATIRAAIVAVLVRFSTSYL